MKKILIIITALVLSMVNSQWSMVKADDFVPAEEAVPENSSPTYVLDSNDSGGDITITFGTSLNESLKWNSSTSLFDLSDDLSLTGGLITSGAINSLNNDSNFATNINTGTSTGAVTIGGTGAQTISVGNGAGVKTVNLGSNNTTSTTTLLSGSGGLNLNASNNQPTNINTGSSGTVSIGTGTGNVSIGNATGTTAVTGSNWNISTAGVATLKGITSTGTVDFSGATTKFKMPQGNGLPGTCTVGEIFYNTADNTTYVCTAINTWTKVGKKASNFEDVYGEDGDSTMTTSNGIFTLAAGSGAVNLNSTGGISLNNNINGVVNVGTGSSTGAVSVGGGSNTVAVNSSDWDITTAGVMTGIGAITMDGLLTGTAGATLSGAAISLNNNSNFAVNVGTGTSTGAVAVGGGSNTVAVNSSDWDVSTTGAMTGISGITNDAALTTSGGAVSINNNSNFATDINTGTSTGAVSIGGGSGTVAVNSTSWDVSTAGVGSGFTGFTSTGTVNFSGASRLAMQSAAANPGTCTEGDLFYNTDTNLTNVCTAANTWTPLQPDTATFTDTNPAAFADNNTTELNNEGTAPNIDTNSTSSTVLVSFNVQGAAPDGDNETFVVSIARDNGGANPECGTDTQVGILLSAFKTDAGVWSISGTFLDSPGVSGNVRYNVCTNSATIFQNDLDTTLTAVNMTLVELDG